MNTEVSRLPVDMLIQILYVKIIDVGMQFLLLTDAP